MNFLDVAAIVLAAGKGTRMDSDLHKVLHTLAGKPIISYTFKTLAKLHLGKILPVVGHKAGEVKKALGPGYEYVTQEDQLGTGHAVLQALGNVPSKFSTILVLNGDDSAFYKPETIAEVINQHQKSQTKMTILTSIQKGSQVSGRVTRNDAGEVTGIKPKSQMTDEDYKTNHEIVCGLYVFDREWICRNLPKVEPDKKGEYNITALIAIAIRQSSFKAIKLKDPTEWRSINTKGELQEARRLQKQLL